MGTEGCRKFKFGEVSVQICQNFLRENQAKIFRLECLFKKLNEKLNIITIVRMLKVVNNFLYHVFKMKGEALAKKLVIFRKN